MEDLAGSECKKPCRERHFHVPSWDSTRKRPCMESDTLMRVVITLALTNETVNGRSDTCSPIKSAAPPFSSSIPEIRNLLQRMMFILLTGQLPGFLEGGSGVKTQAGDLWWFEIYFRITNLHSALTLRTFQDIKGRFSCLKKNKHNFVLACC